MNSNLPDWHEIYAQLNVKAIPHFLCNGVSKVGRAAFTAWNMDGGKAPDWILAPNGEAILRHWSADAGGSSKY